MSAPALRNTVRTKRERLGLSQHALAEVVGVSRQAIIAIEASRQVPSTSLALQLARALRCGVEEIFSLSASEGLSVRLAPPERPSGPPDRGERSDGTRVAVGEVDGRWIAHPLPADPTLAADGIVARGITNRTAIVRPLVALDQLRGNVLVSGCAPVLASLAQRVGRRSADARATWLPAGSKRSLDLLEAGLVHVAGVHFAGGGAGEDNVEVVRRRFAGQRMLVINLIRWRQGLVVPPGNPLAVRTAAALLRPGIKLARREEGAAAHKLLATLLAREGVEKPVLSGPLAGGHAEVAQLVRCGAADVGVAIEGVALAHGLDFVPLTEERFDLVVRAEAAETVPVSRLLDTLDDEAFRTEVAHLPGYDVGIVGHVITVEAA